MTLSRLRSRVLRVAVLVVLVSAAVSGVTMTFVAESAWLRVAGPCLVGAVIGFGWCARTPRRSRGEAVVSGAGVALPRRLGYATGLVTATLLTAVASLCIGVVAVEDDDASRGRRSPLALILLAPSFGYLGLRIAANAARGRGVIRLTPDAVEYDALAGKSRSVPWRHIHQVHLDEVWGTTLTLCGQGDDILIPLQGQAWIGDTVLEAVRRYDAGGASRRAELADPEALERWRAARERDR